ncbi:MAG: porin [Alphaproteobacteria bacterium]
MNDINRKARMFRTVAAGAVLAAPILALSGAAASAQSPTPQEMWDALQRQQEKIDALEQRLEETDTRVEASADAIEAAGTGGEGWWNRTSLGGYGELHYNGGDKDELDFHRFVLFINHQFSDRTRLFSELELEHSLAGDGAPGEVELEQAFIEHDFSQSTTGRAGLFLIPVGILNETHEPPTFYGVERNRVESNIIPTTWWEGGAGFDYTTQNGLRFDALVHGGLDVPITGSNAFRVRSGRQKVAESTLRSPALTGRIRYTGLPGIELATTFQHQFDVTQGDAGDPDTDATLWEAHVDAERQIAQQVSLGLRALYARWDLKGFAAEAVGRDKQYGWYVEPSFKVATGIGGLGFFARYSEDDNNAGNSIDTKTSQVTVGMNYWLHPNVVLKWDFDFQDTPAGVADDDRLNLGIGFQF